MKYMLLIQHGPLDWDSLSDDEQKLVSADYQAVSATPGVRRAPGWSRRSWRRRSASTATGR
jgi:hypothetical protein